MSTENEEEEEERVRGLFFALAYKEMKGGGEMTHESIARVGHALAATVAAYLLGVTGEEANVAEEALKLMTKDIRTCIRRNAVLTRHH
jgi:hypothetical protein